MDKIKDVKTLLKKYTPVPKGYCFKENNLGNKRSLDKKMNLSIIVPCYNVANYLRECIESILNQKTKYIFELILINDGSTDLTKTIIEDYRNINNVIIINQNNIGLSGARNTGLEYVAGEYIMFIDSDDKLSKNAIENLLEIAYKNKAEIVEGCYILFSENKILYKETSAFKMRYVTPMKDLQGYAWGKIIKSNLFTNLIFPEGYWFEDTIMKYLVYSRVNKAIKINDIVYKYRNNPKGITRSAKKNNKSIDSTWITELILNDLSKFKIEKDKKIYIETIKQCFLNYQRSFYLNKEIRKNICIYQGFILKKFDEIKIDNWQLSFIRYLFIKGKYNIIFFFVFYYFAIRKIFNK